ncbi:MAG: hypothetical protein JXB32_16570 [Deltaproteobacteria bacterium]|nr:hypothetical protein [Deltaproteobacteria bacterium]
MSAGAVVFMLLTMGGVLALNALCIGLWLRRGRRRDGPPVSSPPAGTTAEPPAS